MNNRGDCGTFELQSQPCMAGDFNRIPTFAPVMDWNMSQSRTANNPHNSGIIISNNTGILPNSFATFSYGSAPVSQLTTTPSIAMNGPQNGGGFLHHRSGNKLMTYTGSSPSLPPQHVLSPRSINTSSIPSYNGTSSTTNTGAFQSSISVPSSLWPMDLPLSTPLVSPTFNSFNFAQSNPSSAPHDTVRDYHLQSVDDQHFKVQVFKELADLRGLIRIYETGQKLDENSQNLQGLLNTIQESVCVLSGKFSREVLDQNTLSVKLEQLEGYQKELREGFIKLNNSVDKQFLFLSKALVKMGKAHNDDTFERDANLDLEL